MKLRSEVSQPSSMLEIYSEVEWDFKRTEHFIYFCCFIVIKVRKSRMNKFYFTTMKPQVDLLSFGFFERKLKNPKTLRYLVHFDEDGEMLKIPSKILLPL